MTLHSFAGHTLDLGLLPTAGAVLDVGCRGWHFTHELRRFRPHMAVYGLDPGGGIEPNAGGGVFYLPLALVGKSRPFVEFAEFSTGEGSFALIEGHVAVPEDARLHWAPATTITHLSHRCGVQRWAAVKLDCEGAEFEILENWPGPIATQISVEFHDFTDRARWDERYFADLFARLSWYNVVQHELTQQGAHESGRGHWDTLLVLKERI